MDPREHDHGSSDDRHRHDEHATTPGAAGAGAVTGAAIGTAAGGPIGTIVGAVSGAIVGAGAERLMHGGADHRHEEGDEEHTVGDHECRGDDCSHDHRFHYDLVPPFLPLTGAPSHTHEWRDGRCECGEAKPILNPLIVPLPGE